MVGSPSWSPPEAARPAPVYGGCVSDMATGTGDGGGYCPFFQHAIEVIGRRWTGSILRVLAAGPARFSEVRSQVPGLSDRLLDTRLSELVDEAIVERAGDGSYALTGKGRDLEPVMVAVAEWASSHAGAAPERVPGRVGGGSTRCG